MMLISFFTSKKSGASNTKALVTAGLVGGATYGITHYTDWGKANLGQFDGVLAEGANVMTDPETGMPYQDVDGKAINYGAPSTGATGTNAFDVLKGWGATGTAAVIGTTAVATSSSLQKYIPWIIGGVILWAMMK